MAGPVLAPWLTSVLPAKQAPHFFPSPALCPKLVHKQTFPSPSQLCTPAVMTARPLLLDLPPLYPLSV